ncbi:MAG: hypothetical protein IJ088_05040 [Clostridia bacterium]|nr:hypothetical protein [Clostridia bacterium]
MNFEFEKMQKEMHAYIKQHEGEKELEELMQDFVAQYNAHLPAPVTPQNAKTADDYVQLAEESTDDGTRSRYAEKALQLDPDNLDAERFYIFSTTNDPIELLRKLDQAIEHGKRVLKSKGLMDEESIGLYWGILETRPYMRLQGSYVDLLLASGMMRRAAEECREMLRLCERDNLGIRYRLMHIHAYFEDEKAALELWEEREKEMSTQMLLPLSVLYFKLFNLDEARKYLDMLAEVNRDTKKFFRHIRQGKLKQDQENMFPMGYQMDSIEELITVIDAHSFLYSGVVPYFIWADRQLIREKK